MQNQKPKTFEDIDFDKIINDICWGSDGNTFYDNPEPDEAKKTLKAFLRQAIRDYEEAVRLEKDIVEEHHQRFYSECLRCCEIKAHNYCIEKREQKIKEFWQEEKEFCQHEFIEGAFIENLQNVMVYCRKCGEVKE